MEKGVVGPEEDESMFTVEEGKSGEETPMGYVYFSLPETSEFVVLPSKHKTNTFKAMDPPKRTAAPSASWTGLQNPPTLPPGNP